MSVSWMPARFVARMSSARTTATGWGRDSRHSQTNRQCHRSLTMASGLRAWQDACCGSEAHERRLISSCGVKRYDTLVGGSGRPTLSASESESDILASGKSLELRPRGVYSCFCRTRIKYGGTPCPGGSREVREPPGRQDQALMGGESRRWKNP